MSAAGRANALCTGAYLIDNKQAGIATLLARKQTESHHGIFLIHGSPIGEDVSGHTIVLQSHSEDTPHFIPVKRRVLENNDAIVHVVEAALPADRFHDLSGVTPFFGSLLGGSRVHAIGHSTLAEWHIHEVASQLHPEAWQGRERCSSHPLIKTIHPGTIVDHKLRQAQAALVPPILGLLRAGGSAAPVPFGTLPLSNLGELAVTPPVRGAPVFQSASVTHPGKRPEQLSWVGIYSGEWNPFAAQKQSRAGSLIIPTEVIFEHLDVQLKNGRVESSSVSVVEQILSDYRKIFDET